MSKAFICSIILFCVFGFSQYKYTGVKQQVKLEDTVKIQHNALCPKKWNELVEYTGASKYF